MGDLQITVLASLSIQGRAYRVLRYELVEALDDPGWLACELVDDDAPLPLPAEVAGAAARLTLVRSDGAEERGFAGTVVDAQLVPDDDDVPALHLRIVPALFRLDKRADCRIFQDKSAADIVQEVLAGAGISASQVTLQLVGDHPVRPYTVQYRETDLDFLRRLLSEEGIWFAVRAGEQGERFVFCDRPDGLGEIEGATTLPFFDAFGSEGVAGRILRLCRETSVRSDKVLLRDYDPERPSFSVEGEAESVDEGPHALDVYAYPARCTDAAEAKRRAQILLDSVQALRDVVEGEAGSLALLPGLRFSVDGHPYDPLNEQYLVVRSRIAGSPGRPFQAGADRAAALAIEFWGIPVKTTRYRPPRRPRARVIPGAQTAITTGPPGEEIHTDAAGQVKASFHWDRSGKKDDTSSRWMRTSQLALGGSMLLPRVGWEVGGRFGDGDPDQPMVMGRMYNALTPPPYSLPGAAAQSALQTATSPGGGSTNELRMSDGAGGEEMFFNASRDVSANVNNNATESIGNDHRKKIGGNQTCNVTNSVTMSVGANQSLMVGGNQTAKVETVQVDEVGGDHALTIGGNRDLKVGGDHRVDVGGTSTAAVGGNQVDLVVGSVTHETVASFDETVGTALVDLALGDRTVTVGGSRSESVGLAKVIAVRGGRGVDVGGSLDVQALGAVANLASGSRVEVAGGMFTELAIGAQIAKADNVVFEASDLLTLVMGASILSLTPATVVVLGLSAKLDGDVTDLSILVVDN